LRKRSANSSFSFFSVMNRKLSFYHTFIKLFVVLLNQLLVVIIG
jgi:hypothetical protein